MTKWAYRMNRCTAVAAVILILVPVTYAARHHHSGIASGKHCQACLSMVLAVSVVPTAPKLTAPVQSPFRLLPVSLTVENFTGAAARNRAPPSALL